MVGHVRWSFPRLNPFVNYLLSSDFTIFCLCLIVGDENCARVWNFFSGSEMENGGDHNGGHSTSQSENDFHNQQEL